MTNWLYKEKEFTSSDIGEFHGFVYLITDLENGMKYIGKKTFWNVKTLPPLKGAKRKRKIKKESDWKEYYGSNDTIKELVKKYGGNRFKREILILCASKGECSYYEAKLQFEHDVLLNDNYYNNFIMCRINQSHLKKKKGTSK